LFGLQRTISGWPCIRGLPGRPNCRPLQEHMYGVQRGVITCGLADAASCRMRDESPNTAAPAAGPTLFLLTVARSKAFVRLSAYAAHLFGGQKQRGLSSRLGAYGIVSVFGEVPRSPREKTGCSGRFSGPAYVCMYVCMYVCTYIHTCISGGNAIR